MKRVSVCIAGGGSTWTPGIIVGMIKKKVTFPLRKLVLFDNNPERVRKMGEYVKIVLRDYLPDVECFYTCDEKEAFDDIDFVFCQIRTGGFKMREKDEKIPLRMGVIGQETCGPGGFAYGMRSIKDMIELVQKIRKYSKNAWILNYTNPAAIVAIALDLMFPEDKRILNICDQPLSLLLAYSRLLGDVDYKDMVPYYFGLNHFGWFTKILDKSKNNEDITNRIKKIILEEGFAPADKEQRDPSWLVTYQSVNDLLELDPTYLPNTYLQYYLLPRQTLSHLNPDYTRANEVMNGREKRVFDECELVMKENSSKNSKTIEQEIDKKDGIIDNLDKEVLVEVLCTLGKDGPKPMKVGPIDRYYKGLIEQQYAYEKLTVDAYFENSYLKALQALTLNRTVGDQQLAKKLLDELIEANKGYFPELK